MKIAGFKVHRSITLDRVMEACKRHNTTLDNPGFVSPAGEKPMAASLRCSARKNC